MTLFSKEKRQERKDIRMVRKDGMRLKDVKHQTDDIVMEAFMAAGKDIVPYIQNFSPNLYYRLESYNCYGYSMAGPVLVCIPEEKLTHAICMRAVGYSASLLEYVPEKFRDYELYLACVNKDGEKLEFVPKELITEEMCWAAVKNAGKSLQWVPAEFQTEEMCDTALYHVQWRDCFGRSHYYNILPYMHTQTEDLCASAVIYNGMFLESVREQTDKICLRAVGENGLALQFVNNQTKEICFRAIEQNPKALMYIKDKELARLAAAYAQATRREE